MSSTSSLAGDTGAQPSRRRQPLQRITTLISVALAATIATACGRAPQAEAAALRPGASAGTIAAATALASPTFTNLTPYVNNITLRWVSASTTADGIRIERSGDHGATWPKTWTAVPWARETSDYPFVVPEQEWCYRLVAFDAHGDAPPSEMRCTALPLAPTDLTATAAGGGIDLGWTDHSAVEDGYEVERASATEAFHVLARLPASTTRYHDAVASDVTYTYKVYATRDGGGSAYANFATAAVAATKPAAPGGLQVMPGGSPAVGVSWTDASSNEAGFRVERSTDAGASWSSAGTTRYAPSSVWDFMDRGAALEAPTCYRVLAYNDLGDSPPSATACTTAVAAPTELTATPTAEGTVLLTWKDNSAVEDGYCVYAERAGDCFAGDMWPGCLELAPNTTSYVDPGYGPCGEPTYDYQVAAIKDGGWSDFAVVPWTPYP
jgi:hypothetical protein